MATLIRTWQLVNGINVEILDDTVSYYGDYSTVKLMIRCKIEVRGEYLVPFKAHPLYGRATEALGSNAEYVREIVKPGVLGKNLAGIKAFLIDKFEENALGYLEREDFPEKFVRKRFTDLAEELSRKEIATDGDR